MKSDTKLKNLELSVIERLKASSLLNEFKGSLDKLAVILEDIKQFPLSAEELTKVNGSITNKPDGLQSVIWDTSKEAEIAKPIAVQSVTLEYLKSAITAKSEKGELGIGDEAMLSLMNKLEN